MGVVPTRREASALAARRDQFVRAPGAGPRPGCEATRPLAQRLVAGGAVGEERSTATPLQGVQAASAWSGLLSLRDQSTTVVSPESSASTIRTGAGEGVLGSEEASDRRRCPRVGRGLRVVAASGRSTERGSSRTRSCAAPSATCVDGFHEAGTRCSSGRLQLCVGESSRPTAALQSFSISRSTGRLRAGRHRHEPALPEQILTLAGTPRVKTAAYQPEATPASSGGQRLCAAPDNQHGAGG